MCLTLHVIHLHVCSILTGCYDNLVKIWSYDGMYMYARVHKFMLHKISYLHTYSSHQSTRLFFSMLSDDACTCTYVTCIYSVPTLSHLTSNTQSPLGQLQCSAVGHTAPIKGVSWVTTGECIASVDCPCI